MSQRHLFGGEAKAFDPNPVTPAYRPHAAGSDTSSAAAQALDDTALARLESQVFDVIATCPRTCDAVEQATGLSHQTVSARIRGLVLRGRITDSGKRERTRSGRLAAVWRRADR